MFFNRSLGNAQFFGDFGIQQAFFAAEAEYSLLLGRHLADRLFDDIEQVFEVEIFFYIDVFGIRGLQGVIDVALLDFFFLKEVEYDVLSNGKEVGIER